MNKSNTRKIFRKSSQLLRQKDKTYQCIVTGFTLFAITLFAVFLRYEDFPDWQKNKIFFQYQNEYQMANFDSYYYLQICKSLNQGNYDELDEKRRIPNGVKQPAIPPLLSSLTVGIHKITAIPLSILAIFLPIFLSSLLAPVVFLFGRTLNLNRVASLTAALFAIISLTYTIRTRIGVFDTDCLNVVFLLLNSYLFLRFALIKNNRRYLFLTLGILNTFLYFIWWNTAGSVAILSAIIPLTVAILFFQKAKMPIISYGILITLSVVSLYLLRDEIQSYIQIIFNQKQEVFPINAEVTELIPVDLNYFTEKTVGNQFILMLMSIGLIILFWKQKYKGLFITVPLLLALLPFVSGNRFMIFSAPILALGIGFVIQLLFDYKNKIKPGITYTLTILIAALGIYSNYHSITNKLNKTAALENRHLLNTLNTHTPAKSNIWTNWDLGYQIHYYLDRGTYADGEFSKDGEHFYYLCFPLATDNPTVSANFIRFYNKEGISGMQKIYTAFSSEADAFVFLKEILAFSPTEAKKQLDIKLQNQQLPTTENLTKSGEWISFLYPNLTEDIYLLLHQKMLQTVFWFKQGNMDLKTGETMGLPLYLQFHNLTEKGGLIQNNEIKINPDNGIANLPNGAKQSFQHIRTCDENQTKKQEYSKKRLINGKDKRFVFEWNKAINYGAAMSQEMANTTVVKLFIHNTKSKHFEPIALKTPDYQIWKISRNPYE